LNSSPLHPLFMQSRSSALPLPEVSYTEYKLCFIASLRALPSITAPWSTSNANEQHYEVNTDFILSCLGQRAKYSACLWEKDGQKFKTLDGAEDAMMDLYYARAVLKDNMNVLNLGCG